MLTLAALVVKWSNFQSRNLMENEKVKTHLILILSMNAYDGGQGISDV